MDVFNQQRKQARAKRDRAIRLARAKCDETLARIDDAELDALGYTPSSRRPVADCVNLVLSLDRSFSLQDIMDALVASDPQREWPRRIVKNHICKLKRRGLIRWVKRAGGQQPAVYVRATP